jgi:hypothetical protein
VQTIPTTADALMARRSTALAVALRCAGAAFVVVGSTAARLRGGGVSPRDLDLVVTPAGIRALSIALDRLDVRHNAAAFRRGTPVRLTTAWCPLDVFVSRNLPPAQARIVDGCVLVVSHE